MLVSIVLLTEILATMFCLHCIYGEKVKADVWTIGNILGILAILEVINTYSFPTICTYCVYVIFFVYSMVRFKSTFVETLISFVLCMIVITSMQFLCMVSTYFISIERLYVREVAIGVMVFLLTLTILPRCKLHKVQISLCKHSMFVVTLSGFMCLMITIVLLYGKIYDELWAEYFALAIPTILMLLYTVFKWGSVKNQAEKMEMEIQNTEEQSKEYEELLTNVRLRQHELKNHIAAIYSTHYTYDNYENLVQAQEEYCEIIKKENRYNNLILLGNNILVGFLYKKFQEAEVDGIEITYKITTKVDKLAVQTYHVVEMLGILLDNAREALKTSMDKRIIFEVCERNHQFEFLIQNPYAYISYNEILEWFQLEKSEKGSGRGLGLYHLKCLCEEWNCDIGCENIEMEDKNWIAFKLKIFKADNR